MSAADWIFDTAFLLLLYHWVLYPVLIWTLASLSHRSCVPRVPAARKVSILVPAYNEEVTIAAKVRNSLSLGYPPGLLEVLVGSDASSDRTDEIVSSLRDDRVRLIRGPVRGGYSAIMNRLAGAASGEFLLCTDADVLLEPSSLLPLTLALTEDNAGVACVRYERVGSHSHRGENLYDRYESWIKRSESILGVMVGAYGAGMMMRREDWRDLPSDAVLGDMWMGMTALARGLRVVQVHAAKALGPAEDPAGELRRKIRIGRGSMQFFVRNPLLYVPWSGLRGWVVFSHKGLRLLLPWLMLALLAGSAIGSIDSPHHRALLIAQLIVWLSSPLSMLSLPRVIRGLLAPQYLVLMAVGLGLGVVQCIFKPSRGIPDRTPRKAGWDSSDQ